MRAALLAAYGEPDVLQVEEVFEPVPPDGWTVVELRAAALNWHDCLLRRGQYPQFGLPRIPGSDGAGIDLETGKEVIILPGLHWGPSERAPGPDFEILGDRTDGTHAERVTVPRDVLWPRPAGWSWEEAAALTLAGTTAHRALFGRGGLVAGDTVLVLGASGGVSSIAIALARMAGARVLVTTSTEDKLQTAIEEGAAGGVLYTAPTWADDVLDVAGPDGIDLVLDSIGSTWPQALSALKPGGRLVTFGATGDSTVEVDVRRLYFAQQSILGTTMGSPADLDALLALLAQNPAWRPTVGAVLPLDRIAEAHGLLEARAHRGKVVVVP